MILKLIKKLLHHFNYEVVSFAEMTRMQRIIDNKSAGARFEGRFHYTYFKRTFHVYSYIDSVQIIIKSFKIEDYGSEEYAEACAKELCDKLNEKP